MSRQIRVMVVGAGWDQAPIIKEAKRQGHYVIALDANSTAYGLQFADQVHSVSTRDIDHVLALAQRERIDAITYMITESPLYSVRRVCDVMGLPGPSHQSVAATVSKTRMREILSAAGAPTPKFGRAATCDEALAVARRIGLPLVMKPADVGGQLGLAKITQLADVARYFESAHAESLDGDVIMEEMLDGNEFNVVAIVLDGVIRVMTISDRLKHPSLGFGVVLRHLYPAACGNDTMLRIRDLCQQVVTAMEMKEGIVFPQLIVTRSGPQLVEIGARIPGGVMKELFELATGYDLVRLQLDLSLGKAIRLPDYQVLPHHAAVTVKFLTAQPGPLTPGAVGGLKGLDEALKVKGVVEAQYYNDPSTQQTIRPLKNGRDRFFYVIAVGDTREQAIASSNQATQRLDFLDENGASLKPFVDTEAIGWSAATDSDAAASGSPSLRANR